MMRNRALLLDRDGVVNRALVREGKPYPPASRDQLEILPGVAEALARSRGAGFLNIVVSNQPDVARGTQTRASVEEMNRALKGTLAIDDVMVCYHDDADGCVCRKPQPGLLLEAARKYDLDLSLCYVVGDRWRDIDAGSAAGCRTILIDCGYNERLPSRPPDLRAGSLLDAVVRIEAEQRVSRPLSELRVRIFADLAEKEMIHQLCALSYIRGFTTNPTLMRKAGVTDYRVFARDVLSSIGDRPISFEVFADDFPCMEAQAREIASWGSNVYVKIPVTNTLGEPAFELMRRLARSGVSVNATAVMTLDQVRGVASALSEGAPSCVSVFAGRIADTGRDPVPIMSAALEITRAHDSLELIWASPREVLNIFQADEIGCDIITVTSDLLKKLGTVGKDLDEFSVETVRMFYSDAQQSGFRL